MKKTSGAVQTSNNLLAILSAAEFERLIAASERVPLPNGQVLIEANQPIRDVWFPEDGMVSLVEPMGDGSMIEVGLVGCEGMVGTPILLDADRWPIEAMVQMPGNAIRTPAVELMAVVKTNAAFRKLLLRYTQSLLVQSMQSAACNSQHSVNQRLARWLLLAHDRATSTDLKLSHEFIAMMLGVRRAGVTVALATLKEAGVIGTGRGRVTIIDRRRLEEMSCECYVSVKTETGRLLRT